VQGNKVFRLWQVVFQCLRVVMLSWSSNREQHVVQVLPWNHQGEVWVSGMGLAQGYLEDDALTATKFVDLQVRALRPCHSQQPSLLTFRCVPCVHDTNSNRVSRPYGACLASMTPTAVVNLEMCAQKLLALTEWMWWLHSNVVAAPPYRGTPPYVTPRTSFIDLAARYLRDIALAARYLRTRCGMC
jgi:hypothetical protein